MWRRVGGLLSTLPFISRGFSLSFSKLWLIDNEKQKHLNLILRSKKAFSAFASCAVTFSEFWNICWILWQIMVSGSVWIIFNYLIIISNHSLYLSYLVSVHWTKFLQFSFFSFYFIHSKNVKKMKKIKILWSCRGPSQYQDESLFYPYHNKNTLLLYFVTLCNSL